MTLIVLLLTALASMILVATSASNETSWDVSCNYVSAGMYTIGRVCDQDMKCHTTVSATAVLLPSQKACISVNNRLYTVRPVSSWSAIRYDPIQTYECRPLLEGTSVKHSDDLTEGLWDKFRDAGTTNGLSVFSACRGTSSGITICHSHSGKALQMDFAQTCKNECVFAWLKSCGMECGHVTKHFVVGYCPAKNDVRVARVGFESPVYQSEILIDGNPQDEDEEDILTAQLSGEINNPFVGYTMITNSIGSTVRAMPVTPGACNDYCAIMKDPKNNVWSMKGKCFSHDGSCRSAGLTHIKANVVKFQMSESNHPLPYRDPTGTHTLMRHGVLSHHSSAVQVQYVIRQTDPKEVHGKYTQCGLDGLEFETVERECPDEDGVLLISDCLPAIISTQCRLMYVGRVMSKKAFLYSVANYRNMTSCELHISSGPRTEKYIIPVRQKSCTTIPIGDPSEFESRNSKGSRNWKKPLLIAGIIAAALAAVAAAVAGGCLLSKLGLLAPIAAVIRSALCCSNSPTALSKDNGYRTQNPLSGYSSFNSHTIQPDGSSSTLPPVVVNNYMSTNPPICDSFYAPRTSTSSISDAHTDNPAAASSLFKIR